MMAHEEKTVKLYIFTVLGIIFLGSKTFNHLSVPETALHLLATCTVTNRLCQRVLASADLPSQLAPGPGVVTMTLG
jgi:hypothetical protein